MPNSSCENGKQVKILHCVFGNYIPDENIEVKNKLFIPLHSYNDAPNNMVSNFFRKRSRHLFLVGSTVKDAHLGFINVNHFGIHGKEYGTRNMG